MVLDLRAYYSDIDGDSLTFSIASSDNLVIEETGTKGIFEISSLDGWTGAETLMITASDGTETYEMPISIASMPGSETSSATATGGSEGMMMIALVVCAIGMVAVTATARSRVRSYKKPEMEGA